MCTKSLLCKEKILTSPVCVLLSAECAWCTERPPASAPSLPRFHMGVGGKALPHLARLCSVTSLHSASWQEGGVRCSPYLFSIQPFYSLYGDRKVLPHLTLLLFSVLCTASVPRISRPKRPALVLSWCYDSMEETCFACIQSIYRWNIVYIQRQKPHRLFSDRQSISWYTLHTEKASLALPVCV